MNASLPAVSVVVATRNRTDLLARALRSIARQTLANFEVIVVDDGSSEETLAHHEQLVRELGERFQLLKPSVPGARGTGPAAARNRGTTCARGEFLAFIDDDDEWISADYLALATQSLHDNDADYLFGHLVGVRNGIKQNPGWVPPDELFAREQVVSETPRVYKLSDATVGLIAQRFMIHPSNCVIRRDVFVRAGGFFEGLWSHAEDLSLMLRVLDKTHRVLYLAETVTAYRLPERGSISLSEGETMHFLQRILAAQSARLLSIRTDVRKWARAREAWTYREMAQHAIRGGRRAEGLVFACQSLATYPTLGSTALVVKMCLNCVRPQAPAISRTAEQPPGAPSHSDGVS